MNHANNIVLKKYVKVAQPIQKKNTYILCYFLSSNIPHAKSLVYKNDLEVTKSI